MRARVDLVRHGLNEVKVVKDVTVENDDQVRE
jgi:hypothetical protein